MKILIVGSGAREAALARALKADPVVQALFAAPGNPGIAELAECHALPGGVTDGQGVVELASRLGVDLVVVGPEAPLVAGVADAVTEAGFACFGPGAEAARLEGSKAFAKEVMSAAGVPTAAVRVCSELNEVAAALDTFGPPYVVKDDGLAAGKGVVVTSDREEALLHANRCMGVTGGRVVVEEFLDGPEVSLFCITDGSTVVPLAPAQDFKRAFDGDEGPNTGGMGAYSPLDWTPEGLVENVVRLVAQPTVDEMARRGTPFAGLLYIGLAMTTRGPKVVEFNARFGDPETQVVLARLATPLAGVLMAAATGDLDTLPPLEWRPEYAVTVVIASENYPGPPAAGDVIDGLDAPELTGDSPLGPYVLHAGTASAAEGVAQVIAPARDANADIHRSMVEAQSGLRGYKLMQRISRGGTTAAMPSLDADGSEFVKPYVEARDRIAGELDRLDTLMTDPQFGSGPTSQELTTLSHQQRQIVDEWLRYGEQTRTDAGMSSAELETGREIFSRFDVVNDTITTHLDALRQELRAEVRERTSWTVSALILATVIALALALVIGWRTHVALTGPIRALRDIVHRQRAGDRDAWADTSVGAAEMRDLATDVNYLTAEHQTLTDRQDETLRLQEAESRIFREIRGSVSLEDAVRVATRGIPETLHTSRAIGIHLDEGGHVTATVTWGSATGFEEGELSDGVRASLGRLARGMWDGEIAYVIADITAPGDVARADEIAAVVAEQNLTSALLMVPFGPGNRLLGALCVRNPEGPRRWSDEEEVFVQHVAGALTHAAIAFEREHQRDEHLQLLQDLDQQKDVFLSTVSHELRTPLTSINGYVEMLEDGDAGDLSCQQSRMVDVIGRNTQRLRGLIEDLLVLNRLEAAVQSGAGEDMTTAQLLGHVVEELLPVARNAGVDLRNEISDDVLVRGDRAQLGRALTNVVSNGVKFTPAGGSVTLTSRLVEDGRFVELACTDTGMGIPEADQQRLFTRFFRASNATTAQVPGTGLGLVIVQGIVERHGGRLELESVENEGTTVRLLLATASEAALTPG